MLPGLEVLLLRKAAPRKHQVRLEPSTRVSSQVMEPSVMAVLVAARRPTTKGVEAEACP